MTIGKDGVTNRWARLNRPGLRTRPFSGASVPETNSAFRELFSRYASVAHALAFRLVRQAQVAEEIVQEAFLAVWRNPERYDRREVPSARG